MSQPPLPQFVNERRWREAMRAIDGAAGTDEGFIDQVAQTTPVSYVLGYRLRWWQFYLHPRSALLAVVTRRFDRREGWQDRVDRHLRKAEGFVDGIGLDPSRVYGLRFLQLHGLLSPFTVFCASDVVARANAGMTRASQRRVHTVFELGARAACVLATVTAAALIAIAIIDLLAKGCTSCVSAGALFLALQFAVIGSGLFVATFYRAIARARARMELNKEFGWST